MKATDIGIIYREDIATLNTEISNSDHNIKKYRNHKQSLAQRKRLHTTEANSQQVIRLNLDTEGRILDIQQQQTIRRNLEKRSAKRGSITSGTTRRKLNEGLKLETKIKNLSKTLDYRGKSKEEEGKKQNQFGKILKKYNKGPLKQKYLESWLNNLLVEACTQEKFDMTIENSALKKYALDHNSLLSKGLTPDNLNRIYKSLFVYSIGFNELLDQLCKSNMNLRKTIWKVFSILLEYCAEGHFEMMIAQIERDKLKKIQQLTEEIERRQFIIENNEEINEKKNEKIYKEFKGLKQENENLKIEIGILTEQFKQAEQAFNHEVSLRLKYQNRINEIHGVYVEIEQKHNRILRDFYDIDDEREKFRLKSIQLQQEAVDLRQQLKNKNDEISTLQHELTLKDKLTNESQIEKKSATNINIAYKNRIKDLEANIKQKENIISQHQLSKSNLQVILASEKSGHQKSREQLQRSLEENGRLHKTIQQQMKSINMYMVEDRNFALLSKQLRTQVKVITNKHEELSIKSNKQIQQIESLKKQISKLITQNTAVISQKQQLQKDLEVCYQKMAQMKKTNIQLQQEFTLKKKMTEKVDDILNDRFKELSKLKSENHSLKETNESMNREIEAVSAKINILRQKVEYDQQSYLNKIRILQTQKESIQQDYEQYNNIKKSLELQIEKYKDLYHETNLLYKNQLFQRTNLETRYDQSLNVMQQENDHIKDLNIKMSEMREENNSLNRKIKKMEFDVGQLEAQYGKEKTRWENKIVGLSKQTHQKKQYIHPMIYEDMAGRYIILKQLYECLKINYQKQTLALSRNLHHCKQQFMEQKAELLRNLKNKQQQFQKTLDKYGSQLDYEKQKSKTLSTQIKQLEQQLLLYIGSKNKVDAQKQQNYLKAAIKQKSNKVQQLMQQLQKAHDSISELRQNNHQSEIQNKQLQQSVQKDKEVINRLMEENKQIRRVKQSISMALTNKEKQIEDMISSINNNQPKESFNQVTRRRIPENWKWKREGSVEDQSKRKDFVRKYKGAYSYYNK